MVFIRTFISIVIFLSVYYNTPYYYEQYLWKNNGGGRICDVIDLRDYYPVKWPVIYKDHRKVGYVIFCFNDKIWLYSLREEKGIGLGEYVRFIKNPVCEKDGL